MLSTQFEPTGARKAFPCLDEPALKARFSLSVVRESRHISLFNTPLVNTTQYQGDLWLDEYSPSPRMSTYLVAFVICDFKNITSHTKDGVQVSANQADHPPENCHLNVKKCQKFDLKKLPKICNFLPHKKCQ